MTISLWVLVLGCVAAAAGWLLWVGSISMFYVMSRGYAKKEAYEAEASRMAADAREAGAELMRAMMGFPIDPEGGEVND